MKNIIKKATILIFLLTAIIACEEDYKHSPFVTDDTTPSTVTNVEVVPMHGAVKVTYDLPSDKDVLYVKAVFINSKGEEKEVRSSVYNNSLTIHGFGDTSEKEIKIYTVDRSENISDPYQVSFTPLKPPHELIKESMEITTDFGGARYKWINENNTPISIMLFAKADNGEMELIETVYTSQSEQSTAVRGFDTIPRLFTAIIRDRYDNFSDTIYANTDNRLLKPLYEKKLDKTKFNKLVLSNDTNWDAWEGVYEHFYDDKFINTSIIHSQGNDPSPQIYSIDLGQVVKLSRFKVYQRSQNEEHFAYTHGNPKTYTVYGAKELPADDSLEEGSGWIKLRDCESIKPSGSPIGTNTDEDMDHFRAGDEYTFDNAPPIRYFRIAFHKTWDGAGYIGAAEMTVWGSVEEN